MNSARLIHLSFLIKVFRSPVASFNFYGYEFIANSYEKAVASSGIGYALNLILVRQSCNFPSPHSKSNSQQAGFNSRRLLI